MHRRRYAKIVATLGPASSSSEMIRALFEAAADVFRFNFSHGTHDEHQARYDIVRAIGAETGRPCHEDSFRQIGPLRDLYEGLHRAGARSGIQLIGCPAAYIRSQAHAGWTLIRSRYDDGGYSGGATDRPDPGGARHRSGGARHRL